MPSEDITMQRIAVIGGGAAGASVVGEFLRHATELDLAWLVGRHAAPGRGIAYATNDGQHLLNVRAANMGLFADDPGGLYRFIEARALPAKPGDFVPRAWFGDYVESTLQQLIVTRSPGVRVETRAVEAVAVERHEGGYRVRDDEGHVLQVDGIVLALGALPPVPIAQVEADAIESGRYMPDPWRAPPIEHAPQRVVVLGSGLTAVDVILSVAARWPDAQIVALSRHGCLPAVHRAQASAAYAHQPALADALRDDPSIRKWVRLVRDAVRDDCDDWRGVIDALRPVSVELWRTLDRTQRKRFLRHARWAWEAVRHRMPPQTAEAIELLRDEGRLSIVAGRIKQIGNRSPLALTFRRRDDGSTQTISADLAIQATGLQTAVKRTPHRLLRQMLQAGLVAVDAQGLGIEADVHGRATSAGGNASACLRVIGTLLRGVLWECSALPEIRMLAARIARELPTELRSEACAKFHSIHTLRKT